MLKFCSHYNEHSTPLLHIELLGYLQLNMLKNYGKQGAIKPNNIYPAG